MVIVDEHGLAKSPEKAEEENNITPDIIFWRNDGWSLGAPSEYESIAYEMWKDSWVRYGRRPQFIPESMDSYVLEE